MMRTLTLLFILFPFSFLLSQSACPNLDFENGDFTGWGGKVGCNPNQSTDIDIHYGDDCTEPTKQTLDLPIALTLNNLTGQQSIVASNWNGGVDPYVPLLSLTPPNGGSFVARIGDYYDGIFVTDPTNGSGGIAAELSYQLTVDSANALLTAYYAIVLEAPNHSTEENPFFKIKLLDPDGNSVECVEYFQDGVPGAEGFENYNCGGNCTSSADGTEASRDMAWRDWTAISVNLLPYVGQNVTIIFEAGDCSRGAHLGYTYIDLACQPNSILSQTNFICEGVTADLTAPPGMDSYEWHYGDSLGPIVGVSQGINVTDTGFYYCTLTPFSSAANNCPFTLEIYVEPAPSDPEAAFDWMPKPACPEQDVFFIDESTTEDNSPLVFWQWNFDDGKPVSNEQNPTHIFDSEGLYDVELVIESVDGCRDTITQSVEVKKDTPVISDPGIICSEDEPFDFEGTPSDGVWSGVGIIDSVKGTFDPVLAFAIQANPITISYKAGRCGEVTQIDVNITLQANSYFPPAGPYCNDALDVTFIPDETGGVWSGTGIDASGVFSPMNAEIGENVIQYAMYGNCPDSTEQTIIVNPRRDATITPVSDVCFEQKAFDLEAATEDGIWQGAGVNSNGRFDPGVAGVGTHEIIYYFEEPCPSADTISITVIVNKDPSFDGFGPLCENADSVIIIPLESGGTWSGPGVDANGVFRPDVAGPGDHSIIYGFGEQCGGTQLRKIEVIANANAEFTAPDVLCPKDDPVRLRADERGGTWSGMGVDATGLFDPASVPTNQNIAITYTLGGLCPDTVTHIIFIKDLFDSTIDPAGPYCEDDNPQTLSAVDIGGTWSGNGITDPDAGTFDPSVAGEGNHIITYSIPGNCGTTSTYEITVERRPIATIVPIVPLCHNGDEITLNTVESGGIWSGDAAANGTFDPKNYSPGTYKAYYSFNGLCSSIDSIDIIITEPISIVDNSTNLTCKNSDDGEIQTTVNGGFTSAPYTYAWLQNGNQRPENTSFLQNISADNYTVTVTDLYGCINSLNVTITEPDSLLYNLQTDSSNCMQANGSAEVINATGGTAPYNYLWNNGVTTPLNSNIAPAVYTVDVSDQNNCITTRSIEVFDIAGPTANVVTDSVSCYLGNNGSATLNNISNGEAPFSISWSTNLFNDNNQHINLSAGNYSATVTDATGCFSVIPFSIYEPSELSLTADNDTLLCVAQDVTLNALATGGIAPYRYFWDNDGPLGSTYFVNSASRPEVYAMDVNDCVSNTESINVTYRTPLSLDVLPNDTTICAGQDIELRSTFSGGTGNYSFTWDDGNNNSTRPYSPQGDFGDTLLLGLTLSDNCSPQVYDFSTITFFEPAQPNFVGIPAEGCEPLQVDFIDLSVNVASLNWNLGDGTFRDGLGNFTNTYLKGLYTISLDAVSPNGCLASLVEPDYIESFGNPVADFTWSPKPITLLNDEIQFSDRSLGDIDVWDWEFYSIDSVFYSESSRKNPVIKSPAVLGNHLAYLHVTTLDGCVDSTWKVYDIEPNLTVYVPNTFTPNGDRVNEGWRAVVRGIIIDDYKLTVYNRWGEIVWETADPDEFWNGSFDKNPTEIVKTDVYIWRLELRDFKSIKHVYTGNVNILK